MIPEDLRNEFKALSGDNWINSQGEPDIDYVSWLEKKLIKNHGVSHHVISTFKCPHGLDCKEPCVMHGKGNHSMCY